MTTSPNVYTTLLLYSVVSGVFLRIVRDALDLLILPYTASHRTVPTTPLPMQNTTTARAAIKKLNPPIRKRETVARLTTDLLFSLICTVTVILLLFGLNFGEMRWFVLPIIAAGYFAYGATVGRPIRALLRAVLTVVLRILKTALHLITAPIVKLLAVIKRVVIKISTLFSNFHRHPTQNAAPNTATLPRRKNKKKKVERKSKKTKLFFKNPLTKTKK